MTSSPTPVRDGQASVPPRPDVIPAEPFSVPTPSLTRLANGLTVLSYHLPGQYVISVRLAIPLPLAREPRDKEGVASIMSRTLDEGTARHTSVEFARMLERRGVALGAGMGEGGLSVDLDVAKRHLPDALDLLRQCITEPAFPQDQVERHVATRLAEIEQEYAVPAHRGGIELWRTYFDSQSRSARPVAGQAETVASITRDDVVAFHDEHVRPNAATIVVAGDLTGIDAASFVLKALGEWEIGETDSPLDLTAPPELPDRQPPALADDRARIVIVDRPDSVQAELLIACAGPDRHVEGGFAPFPMLGFILGGAPTSRLDLLLREDKGYTYGLRSGFRPRRRGGVFITSGSVRGDVAAEALDLTLSVLEDARAGVTDDEIAQARSFLTLTAPSRYATADTVAEEAAALSFDGLGTDFADRTLRAIAAASADEVSTAYRQFVDGSWTVVVVGDAASIAEPIAALGRGTPTVVAS
ncbi:MAG: insulinase family protein [Dermatophilaceae bacterium]|nr:insulinase family protein [Actinomycetales bacterium]MBP8880044.1 insulinase family protein [Dermatophilaceae bacterium]MBP9917904.1 insulinase family protein [Dermatophilaceae bacterium]